MARPVRHRAWPLLLAVLLAPASCTYPTDAERYPRQGDRPFTFMGSDPGDGSDGQPTNVVVRLRFSDFPDPGALGAVVLTGAAPRRCAVGGGGPGTFPCQVELLRREVVLRPELAPNQEHVIEVGAELHSLAGVALGAPLRLRIRTGAMAGMSPMLPRVTLADVLGSGGGLRASCSLPVVCHTPSQIQPAVRGFDLSLPEAELLRFLTTTAGRGSPEGLLLVEPGRPEQSYLFRKLVAFDGFARIEGDPMPLPPYKRLPDSALQLLNDWIRQGAPQ